MEKHTPRLYYDTIHLWHFLRPMLSIMVARLAAKHNINSSPGKYHDRSDGVAAVEGRLSHCEAFQGPFQGYYCVLDSTRLILRLIVRLVVRLEGR